jgi:hypothetical protein
VKVQHRAGALALSLGLACIVGLALRSETEVSEARQARAPAGRRAPQRVQAPPVETATAAALTERDHDQDDHDHGHGHGHAPSGQRSAPPAAAPSKSVVGPLVAEPPSTPDSWIVPLELGWNDARAEEPIRSEVDFRPLRPRLHDVLFQARFSDASGALYSSTVPVAGLIPLELADEGQELHAIGDQLLVSRAPVLLRLPDLELPIHVELSRPDGQQVATLLVHEVSGKVRVAVQ